MTFSRRFIHRIAISLIVASLANATSAGPGKKPKPSYPADPKEVIKLYTGHTWNWSQGGSYWGKGGKFEGIWKEELGLGKWYVTTKGTLCYEANWYTQKGKPPTPYKECWEHVKDSNGKFYQQPTDPKDRKKWGWGQVRKLTKGNSIKSEIANENVISDCNPNHPKSPLH